MIQFSMNGTEKHIRELEELHKALKEIEKKILNR